MNKLKNWLNAPALRWYVLAEIILGLALAAWLLCGHRIITITIR